MCQSNQTKQYIYIVIKYVRFDTIKKKILFKIQTFLELCQVIFYVLKSIMGENN